MGTLIALGAVAFVLMPLFKIVMLLSNSMEGGIDAVKWYHQEINRLDEQHQIKIRNLYKKYGVE